MTDKLMKRVSDLIEDSIKKMDESDEKWFVQKFRKLMTTHYDHYPFKVCLHFFVSTPGHLYWDRIADILINIDRVSPSKFKRVWQKIEAMSGYLYSDLIDEFLNIEI